MYKYLICFLLFFSLSTTIAFPKVKKTSTKNLKEKNEIIVDKYPGKISDLKPGIKKHHIEILSSKGPVVINVLEIDLLNEKISFMVGLPDEYTLKKRMPLSKIVEKHMAYAGINANYFDLNVGNPLGLIISGGKKITGPVFNRAVVGFSNDKKIFFDKFKMWGNININRGLFKKKYHSSFQVNCYNTPPHIVKEPCLIDSRWGFRFHLNKGQSAAVVENGCIKKISRRTVNIPINGFIIAGEKESLSKKIKDGDCLNISWDNFPKWETIKEAISGGPYLIMNGEIFIDDVQEKLIFKGKNFFAPRTAIGINDGNKLFLVTVDGRQEGYSVGMSLEELAKFLKEKFKITEAINLDGGGSTELFVDGKILNVPSEKEERPISNALLIFISS